MALSLRPTNLSSLRGLDYCVIEDGQVIGRVYEDRHTRPGLQWFWSITMHIDPALGVTTDGRTPTLEIAKEEFKSSWSKVRESDEQKCFARS